MKQAGIKNLSNAFLMICLSFFLFSCESLSPYKVPILQGNIFEEKIGKNIIKIREIIPKYKNDRGPKK